MAKVSGSKTSRKQSSAEQSAEPERRLGKCSEWRGVRAMKTVSIPPQATEINALLDQARDL